MTRAPLSASAASFTATTRSDEMDSIPDFLRISADERKAAWKGRQLTQVTDEPARDWSIPQSLSQAEREEIQGRRSAKEAERKAQAREALERMKAEHEANGEIYIPPVKDKNGVVLRRGYWKAKGMGQ